MRKLLRAFAHSIFAWVLFTQLIVSAQAANASLAEINHGLQWLNDQVQPDGQLKNTAQSIATSLQNRAEAVQTLQLLATLPPVLATSAALDADDNTEYLARRIVHAAGSGQDFTALLDQLLARQNADGGFGGSSEYASNPLDTAFSLLALKSSAQSRATLAAPAALIYLQKTQQADGAFQINRQNDVYTSAYVLLALKQYTASNNLSNSIQLLTTYLVAQQSAPGVWQNTAWLSAIVYQSIHDFVELEPSASLVRAFLLSKQQADGSWDSDPFISAQVLRALALTNAAGRNPLLANLRGTIIDAQSGLAIHGAQVTLSGASRQQLYSGMDGSFVFGDLPADNYTLGISFDGYDSVSSKTSLKLGQQLDFGMIRISKQKIGNSGTLRGQVKDAANGQVLAGVTVTLTVAQAGSNTLLSASTDASGNYQISNVPVGALTMLAEKSGYNSLSASATMVADTTVIFSPKLPKQAENSKLATLRGVASNAATGAVLSGVQVRISGANNVSAITDSSGVYVMTELTAGPVSIVAQLPGYDTVVGNVTLSQGATFNFSPKMGLSANLPPNANRSVLTGIVLDAASNLPLPNVNVSVAGSNLANTMTDANGAYTLGNLAAGAVTISVQLSGYDVIKTATVLLQNNTLTFSPKLTQISPKNPYSASVTGKIVDAANNQPLANVQISTTGSNTVSGTTDVNGQYLLAGLLPGAMSITTELNGYDKVVTPVVLNSNSVLTYSPKLYAAASTPPNANTASVSGIVLDAASNTPLANVTLTSPALAQPVTSDANGRFTISAVSVAVLELNFALANYQQVKTSFVVTPLMANDLGQVRLRKDKVEKLLADLIVKSVTHNQALTDQQSLQLSGNLSVSISNNGNAVAPASVEVLAFHDANRNGVFDTELDQVLGRAFTPSALEVGASLELSLNVTGKLPFRDAPIHIWVDSLQQVIESNEQNNITSTASFAAAKPNIGSFKPVLKWWWKGSSYEPKFNGVETAPLAMQTNDDNGDGKIDSNDTPDIAFISFNYDDWGDGVFRIISGKDGTELAATRSPGGYKLAGWPSIASADLDGDGLVEFLLPGYEGTLVAVSNTGQFKWAVKPDVASNSSTFGGPNIVDLDGDGKPSILLGPNVINANGTKRWSKPGANVGGQNSSDSGAIAADLDLDGYPDVILGAQAYDRNGKLMWKNDVVGDGLTAVGNFNDDPYPEIVVVSKGKVYLLDHLGKIIWGPVTILAGGRGGAPTIADMDGDGKADIGVAGSIRYTVLRGDGTIMWETPIVDHSSARTGSTVFDFDGDGKAEIVYSDETKLHVFDGASGKTVFEQESCSSTAAEYPIVVDIDNDNHADMVVTGSCGEYKGIRVFKDANNSWVNARSIWNQHAYHITNINDDGSVPRKEINSWEAHNTYRLNTRLDVAANAIPDVTASLIRIDDQGSQAASSITVRIGNASALRLDPGVKIAFYSGDVGNTLLGVVSTRQTLAMGEYEDVKLVLPAGFGDTSVLSIVADDDGKGNTVFTDFDRNNNKAVLEISALPPAFTLAVSTDLGSYPAESTVQITSLINNPGRLNGTAQLRLRIETAQGETVAELPAQTVGVAHDSRQNVFAGWQLGSTLPGQYQVRAQLVNQLGAVSAQAVARFTVLATAAGASIGLSSNKLQYLPTDSVQLVAKLRNTSSNTPLNNLRLLVTLQNPDGTQRYDSSTAITQLLPGSLQPFNYSVPLQNAPAGNYLAKVEVLAQEGTLLAQATTQFAVISTADSGSGLLGTLSVSPHSVPIGDSVVLQFGAVNQGNSALTAVPLKLSIIDPVAQTVLAEFAFTPTLAIGARYDAAANWLAAGVAGRTYVAVLKANFGGKDISLAQDNFVLAEPQVKLEITQQLIAPQTLLVYSACKRAADDLLGQCGATALPVENASTLAKCDSDRALALGNYLSSLGVKYKLVSNAPDFRREMRSGRYNTYWLSNGATSLREPLASELRAALTRGESLMLDGISAGHNRQLSQCAGVQFNGKYGIEQGLAINGDLFGSSAGNWRVTALPVKLAAINGALAQGKLGDGNPTDGIVSAQFGAGKTLVFGFDLVDTLRTQTADTRWRDILQKSFDYLKPEPPENHEQTHEFAAGQVLVLNTKLRNLGAAAKVQVQKILPMGTSLPLTEPLAQIEFVMPLGASSPTGMKVSWTVDLAANSATDLNLQWRAMGVAPENIVTSAKLLKGTEQVLLKDFNFALNTTGANQLLQQLIAQINAIELDLPQQIESRKLILLELARAQQAVSRYKIDDCLRALLTVQARIAQIEPLTPASQNLAKMIAVAQWLKGN